MPYNINPIKYLHIYLPIFLLLLIPSSSLINILTQGAIPHTDTLITQFHNSQIITKSILKANSSLIDRVVKIPSHTFYSMPIVLSNIHNISIIIQGKLSASKNVLKWPKKPNSAHYQDFIYISDSSYIQISGSGKIDGRGYHWWMIEWLRLKKLRPLNSARPHMLNIQRCQHFKIHDLILKNSPCFHIRIYGSFYFDIYNLDIKVNTTAQLNLAKLFTPSTYSLTTLQGIIPLFPLNTDGIDPAGKYFHIFNISVQNYDDVVVPKPSHAGTNCNCSEYMLIENITVRLGVGLSIGSVPPNSQHNCIRHVVFRNGYFVKPFKGIYIKTNPGNAGSGEIVNITYTDMYMEQPIWWAIYLGPQQQKQPLGGGPGCMLYPFDPRGTCATQPRINIRDIVLENVQVRNSLLFPIVLRCNQSNPCTGVELRNVKVNRWFIGKKKIGYVCENVVGRQVGGYPRVDCLKAGQEKGEGQEEIGYGWNKQEGIQHQQLASNPKLRKQYTNPQNQDNTNTPPTNIQFINYLNSQFSSNKPIHINKIWKYLQQRIKSVPYQEQDDQMSEHEDILQMQSILTQL